MNKSLRLAYTATLQVLVVASSDAEASDAISETLHNIEERLTTDGTLVDWRYVDPLDGSKDVLGAPKHWSEVLISGKEDYEEGEFFHVPDASVTIHNEWYDDGPDSGEELWRIDPEQDIQVQLFASVKDETADVMEFTGKWRIFIEHDVRDNLHAGNRVKYSGEEFPCDASKARRLLAMNGAQVQDFLAAEIAAVKALPDDPAYH